MRIWTNALNRTYVGLRGQIITANADVQVSIPNPKAKPQTLQNKVTDVEEARIALATSGKHQC